MTPAVCTDLWCSPPAGSSADHRCRGGPAPLRDGRRDIESGFHWPQHRRNHERDPGDWPPGRREKSNFGLSGLNFLIIENVWPIIHLELHYSKLFPACLCHFNWQYCDGFKALLHDQIFLFNWVLFIFFGEIFSNCLILAPGGQTFPTTKFSPHLSVNGSVSYKINLFFSVLLIRITLG